jgi:hypothetical protein
MRTRVRSRGGDSDQDHRARSASLRAHSSSTTAGGVCVVFVGRARGITRRTRRLRGPRGPGSGHASALARIACIGPRSAPIRRGFDSDPRRRSGSDNKRPSRRLVSARRYGLPVAVAFSALPFEGVRRTYEEVGGSSDHTPPSPRLAEHDQGWRRCGRSATLNPEVAV